jgi:MFS family permease
MANGVLQTHTEPAMRGRVMALFSVAFLGSTPIGGPIVGWVSQAFGPRAGLALGGLATLVTTAGAWAVRHPAVRTAVASTTVR